MKLIYSAVLALILSVVLNSCLVVKIDDEVQQQEVKLSPKPIVKMSDKLVRSEKGDMIALLPEGWFFIDVESDISDNIFAVAVNRDYTLSAVFSNADKTPQMSADVEKGGLVALAKHFLSLKNTKTGGAVKQTGKFKIISSGNLSYCNYSFSSTGGASNSSAAVFISSLDRCYEFSLLPMNLTGKSQPSKKDIQDIFDSILATIQY